MSTCSDMTVVPGCVTHADGTKTPISIHYEYRLAANGNRTLHATWYTDAVGAPMTPAGTDTVATGTCGVAPPDVEFETLCDTSAAGVTTEFVRRIITSFDSAGAATTVTADLQFDLVTPYAPTGTVGKCNKDCDVVAPVGLQATWG